MMTLLFVLQQDLGALKDQQDEQIGGMQDVLLYGALIVLLIVGALWALTRNRNRSRKGFDKGL